MFEIPHVPLPGSQVYVTLPQPTILSHEVYPRVDKLDVGFLAGINGEEMNRNFNELRRTFRQDAIENDHILDKARMRADSVMQLLLGPTVKAMGRNYKLEIRFKDTPESLDADEQRRRGQEPKTQQAPAPAVSSPQPVKLIPQ